MNLRYMRLVRIRTKQVRKFRRIRCAVSKVV